MRAASEKAQLQTLHCAFAHVRDWSAAIDGGAYRGEWTAVMAKRFGAVHAFEPACDLIDDLAERFVECKNVTVYHLALWSEVAQVKMLPDPDHPLKKVGRYVQPGGDIVAIPIDGLNLPSCGLIKLDLEGAEMLALQGAKRTISHCRPVVICECKPSMAARFNATADDPGHFLARLGYREVERHKPDRIFVRLA